MKNYQFIFILSLLFFAGNINSQESQIIKGIINKGKELPHTLHVSSGSLKRFFFQSDISDHRNIDVWLPEDYSPTKQYPVLYMHDGQNLFDVQKGSAGKEWQVDENMQKLISENKIRESIVVGIWNTGMKRHSEYFPQKAIDYISQGQRKYLVSLMPNLPLGDNYLRFITTELKPFIDITFSTYPDRPNTFICGSSMGGLISLYALCEYPEIFGGAGCISTHWIGTFDNNPEIPEGINEYLRRNLPSPYNHKIYFDYGTLGLDANYQPHQALVDKTMEEKNYDKSCWITLEFPEEDHNEKFWSARLHHPLIFLLGN